MLTGKMTGTGARPTISRRSASTPPARAAIARLGARDGYDWLHLNSATYVGPNRWFDAGDKRFDPRQRDRQQPLGEPGRDHRARRLGGVADRARFQRLARARRDRPGDRPAPRAPDPAGAARGGQHDGVRQRRGQRASAIRARSRRRAMRSTSAPLRGCSRSTRSRSSWSGPTPRPISSAPTSAAPSACPTAIR